MSFLLPALLGGVASKFFGGSKAKLQVSSVKTSSGKKALVIKKVPAIKGGRKRGRKKKVRRGK